MFSPCRLRVGSLQGYSSFLPPSKNMHVRLTGNSKLYLGVSVDGCFSLCGPVMDWRPVQGIPASHPMTAGIGSRPPRVGLSGYRKWMDGK